jgi:hypothetical protein
MELIFHGFPGPRVRIAFINSKKLLPLKQDIIHACPVPVCGMLYGLLLFFFPGVECVEFAIAVWFYMFRFSAMLRFKANEIQMFHSIQELPGITLSSSHCKTHIPSPWIHSTS